MWFMARWLAVPASLNTAVAGTRRHGEKQETKTIGELEHGYFHAFVYGTLAFGSAPLCLGFCMASECGRFFLIGFKVSIQICKRNPGGIRCHLAISLQLLEGNRVFLFCSAVAVDERWYL